MQFMRTRQRHPRLHSLFIGIIAFSCLYSLSAFFIDPALLKRWAFPITGLFAAVFLLAGLHALRSGQSDARFYVVGWTGLLACAAVTTISHWFEGLLAVGLSFEAIRLGVLLDATMMGLAIVDQYAQTRSAQTEAEEAARQALADRLELQNRFLRLDERYRVAYRTASERGLKLANASHDLRQPLGALRSAIGQEMGQGIGGAQDKEAQASLQSTVTYLETLVDRYLAAATDPADTEGSQSPLVPTDERVDEPANEHFPVDVVFRNLQFMFENDASEKGLELRIVPSSVTLDADPLAVMRILSNLITNAIRYTDDGRVLVGCRRGTRHARLVVADSGMGMPADEVDELMQPFVRGVAQSEDGGLGLGLSIVADLVNEHGYSWAIQSAPGRGSLVAVQVPVRT